MLTLVLVLPLCGVPVGLVGGSFLLLYHRRSPPPNPDEVNEMAIPHEEGQPMQSVGITKAVPPGDAMISFAAKGQDVTGFLASGVSVNVTDENGTTALMAAARNGHLETAQVLLGKGANVNAKDKSDKTALDYAEPNRHEDVVAALRARGAFKGSQLKP